MTQMTQIVSYFYTRKVIIYLRHPRNLRMKNVFLRINTQHSQLITHNS